MFSFPSQPVPESFHPENTARDPRIFVQDFVIEKLNFSGNLDEAAIRYVDEGYAKKCRELMESNSHVRSLLHEDNYDEASTVLRDLLLEWKQIDPLQQAA